MTTCRILVVDDEPDIRRVVERSLARDPELAIRTCTCGQEALAAAAAWSPDLILLDVMMPVMDGPSTLAALRENPLTAGIPVIFLTARAQASELAHFKSIGATGIIAKPFDPKALRAAVRDHLSEARPAAVGRSIPPAAATTERAPRTGLAGLMSDAALAAERNGYLDRLRGSTLTLNELRGALRSDATSPAVLDELRTVTHKLAGSAGLYGFAQMSVAAAALEDTIIERQSGRLLPARVEADLDALLDRIEREQAGRTRSGEDTPAAAERELQHD